LSKEIAQLIAKHAFLALTGFGVLCILLAALQTIYVSFLSKNIHWSKSGLNWILPTVVAFVYYCVALYPLLMATYGYSCALRITATYCHKTKDFDPAHKDQMFGLSGLGRSILLPSVTALIASFPLLVIQWQEKNELTVTNFVIAPIITLSILWFICFKPLWLIYDRLENKKSMLYKKIKENIKNLESQLRASENANQINLIQQKLNEERKQEEIIYNLKTIPLSKFAQASGSLAVIVAVFTQLSNLFSKLLKTLGLF
jgi:hypothetical protein